MTVKEVNGRWHTVSSSGKVGKRAFKSRASAEAAQDRGRALAGQPSTKVDGSGSPAGPIVRENPDTADERRKLGIPALDEQETGGF